MLEVTSLAHATHFKSHAPTNLEISNFQPCPEEVLDGPRDTKLGLYHHPSSPVRRACCICAVAGKLERPT